MDKQKQIDKINKEIDELEAKVWQLELKKRKLNGHGFGAFGILGCENTKH